MELEEPTITQEMLEQARLHGACAERLSRYTVGMPLVAVKQDDLMWVEQNAPSLARQLEAKIEPLESLIFGKLRLSDISYGFGYGFGLGYGYGAVDGYGDGEGSGYGDGSGGVPD